MPDHRAHLDPLRQQLDLGGGQLLVAGRHLPGLVLTADRRDEQALLGIAGHDGGAGIAALEQPAERIDDQPAARLVGGVAVTAIAVLGQDRLDLLLVELDAFFGRRRIRAAHPKLPVITLLLKPGTEQTLSKFPYRDVVREQQLSVKNVKPHQD